MKEDTLIMSQKERQRKGILTLVKEGHLNLVEAAKELAISYRQCRRIWQRYRLEVDQGLVHRSRVKSSPRAFASEFKEKIIAHYKTRYMGFGPTLACEKLLEHEGIKLSCETLRQWLLDHQLWHRKRKHKRIRQRRERRESFGELLQIDGSIHDWFGDGNHTCLLNMVDDATGITLSQLARGETTEILFKTLWLWIARYGVPKAVYVDLKTVYVSPKKQDESDSLPPKSQSEFERVCDRLGIQIIRAYSPQAKGRVERSHGIYQDRFVKELRLNNLQTIDEANAFLLANYLDKINAKFAKEPQQVADAPRFLTDAELKEVLCWEVTRQVQYDGVIRYASQYYQILPSSSAIVRPKQSVVVRKYLDGSIGAFYQGKRLDIQLIATPMTPRISKKEEKAYDRLARSQQATANKHKSPWSQYNPDWLKNTAPIDLLHEAKLGY